ncbi:YfcC family protein [Clostridium sp. DL1XJH146]
MKKDEKGINMKDEKKVSSIGLKTFLVSMSILLCLMIFAGIISRIIPAGSFERVFSEGRTVIDPDSFHYVEKGNFPIWRWFTAPIEVLWGEDFLVIDVIIIFLFFVGGSVNVLKDSNVINAIIGKIITRFEDKKYILMGSITLVFMLFGSMIGMFEEVVLLIPIMVALSYCFGWDALVGVGMVLLAAGFGFTAAIANPFTIGVAQNIAELPVFSGAGYRILVFAVIYTVFMIFLVSYAKKIEKDPTKSIVYDENIAYSGEAERQEYIYYAKDKKLNRAINWFNIIILILLLILISGSFISSISDYSLPIVGVLFLFAGIGSGKLSGMSIKKVSKSFISGCSGIAPGVILILMAASIKHIINNAGVMDTILYQTANFIKGTSPFVAILIVYLLVLFMNFFIGSGSAKAFLIMPIVIPIAEIIGVNRQIMVLAFQFGDGFSNMLYPTNPVLLISLGLTVISYPKWFKWTIKLQLVMMFISTILLEVALLINYGPF